MYVYIYIYVFIYIYIYNIYTWKVSLLSLIKKGKSLPFYIRDIRDKKDAFPFYVNCMPNSDNNIPYPFTV